MSLREIDRKLIAESFEAFERQTEQQTVPLSRVIPWLAVTRACRLIPRASSQVMDAITKLVQSDNFGVPEATQCFNLLRADLLPSTSILIAVVRCQPPPASETGTCTEEATTPGCDRCAGRQYFAKTNGSTVWMAEECFTTADRLGGAEMLRIGNVSVRSLTTFIMCHEFAHMMQQHGDSLRPAIALYKEAVPLIPAHLREQGRVKTSEDDSLDFAANSFAYESTRSDRDARSMCQ